MRIGFEEGGMVGMEKRDGEENSYEESEKGFDVIAVEMMFSEE